jgi:hypothetical protein
MLFKRQFKNRFFILTSFDVLDILSHQYRGEEIEFSVIKKFS